jgi:hypothetical protein
MCPEDGTEVKQIQLLLVLLENNHRFLTHDMSAAACCLSVPPLTAAPVLEAFGALLGGGVKVAEELVVLEVLAQGTGRLV